MSCDPLRRRALDVLTRLADGADLDPLLDAALDRTPADALAGRGRPFLAELVRGTLQWQGRYDHLIATFATRNPPRDPRLRALLRMSLHQLVGMDGVPPRATLHQAGELCRSQVSARLVGFVNGLLQTARRALRPDPDEDGAGRQRRLRAVFADLEGDGAAWLAAWHSLPRWLVERWLGRWDPATVAGICTAANELPPVTFRVLEGADPREMAADLVAAGCPVAAADDPRRLRCLERPRRVLLVELLATRPHLIVQDSSVQEATTWLLDDDLAGPGPVVDLCAAPGGKTARLAAAWPAPEILAAVELRAPRVGMLAAAAKRIEQRPVSVVLADGRRPPFRPASCAAVLLDGPCSGTGVLRRHPDGRWRVAPADPARHGRLLTDLGRQAAGLLRPGGLLMYATCSLEPEENERVVGDLLHAVPELVPAPDTQGRWQRRWLPGQAPGDGFYAARLRHAGDDRRGKS